MATRMPELPRIILTPAQKNSLRKVRLWLYSLTLAAFPVAIHYDVVAPEAAPLWIAVAVALFNLSPKEQGYDFYLEQEDK